MLNKNGEKINKIRRIRCYVSSGRGTLKHKTSLPIHKHSFQSTKSYKKTTYSITEDNIYCLFYEGQIKGKQKREFKILSTYDLAQIQSNSIYSLIQEPYFSKIELKDFSFIPIKFPLKKGTKVIPYEKNVEELKELEHIDLIKRVYKVYKFNLMTNPYIYLKHHLIAMKDSEINDEITSIDLVHNPMKYKLVAKRFDFAIEGLDFKIEIDGKIKWLF